MSGISGPRTVRVPDGGKLGLLALALNCATEKFHLTPVTETDGGIT